DMPQKTPSWIDECVKAMMGAEPNKATVDDIFWGKFEDQGGSKKHEKRSNALNSSSLIDRMEFLKLLVRMKRVILQDAVVFMKPRLLSSGLARPKKDGDTLTNSLITSMPHVFESEMFLYFSSQLEKAIEEHRSRPSLVDLNVQLNTRTLISSMNNLSVQASSEQSQIFAKMQEMSSAQQVQVEQVDKRVRNVEV
ncbi:hypothetical protein BGZ79_004436, partial [Entomortierella chlamydospora]